MALHLWFMNSIQEQASGNGVVILIAGLYNLLLTISYRDFAEYALYTLVGNLIGALVWLIFKKISDRMGGPGKVDLFKIFKRTNRK